MARKTTARCGASRPKALRPFDVLFLGGQRPRAGKCDRARRGAIFRNRTSTIDRFPTIYWGRGSSLTLHDPPTDASLFEIVEDVERRIISDMLEKCNWNQTEAAERFKVPLSTLDQKNPTVEYRNQEEERGARTALLKLERFSAIVRKSASRVGVLFPISMELTSPTELG